MTLTNPRTLPVISWAEIQGKPSAFPPSTHSHSATEITSGVLSVDRLPTDVVLEAELAAAIAGLSENIDGGAAATVYGVDDIIDGGAAT